MWTVYMHVNKVNGKKYVGITSQNPEKRWEKGHNYKQNDHFYKAIKKYGWDGFEHRIIKQGLTCEEANHIEIEVIAKHKTNDRNFGYNNTLGGMAGIPSQEARKRQSESQKKRYIAEDDIKKKSRVLAMHSPAAINKNKETQKQLAKERGALFYSVRGKMADPKNISEARKRFLKNNPEAKLRMSESKKQYYQDNPEELAKMSERAKKRMTEDPGLQRKMVEAARTPEAIAKNIESRKQWYKNNPDKAAINNKRLLEMQKKCAQEKRIKIICIDTGRIFDKAEDAANSISVTRKAIVSACRGVSKTSGGYRWQYLSEYEKQNQSQVRLFFNTQREV